MGIVKDAREFMHAFNTFRKEEEVGASGQIQPWTSGGGSTYYGGGGRPDRILLNVSNDRSIIGALYTRMAVDVASIDIRHVRQNESKQYMEDIESGLNNCLTLGANIDQNARQFRQHIATMLFAKGVAAIVPVDTNIDPEGNGSINIETMRVGEVVEWFPKSVRVRLYNDNKGMFEDVTVSKKHAAIVENPLYNVMNEPNGTLQRLLRKLAMLDTVDEQVSSGKLDIIVQLPYTIKNETKRLQAENRRKDLEAQLKGSKYGIGYMDATERITQLNRPAENNMLEQIKVLTAQLYNQLGLTESIFDGSADEQAMLNYHNRTIEPIMAAITLSMKRAFLTKTAISQRQSIEAFRDPFKLVPVANLAEIADKFTRNEILSPNEIRAIIGVPPSKDPKADELRNRNVTAPAETDSDQPTEPATEKVEGAPQNGA